ncbi:hypothetical protein [Silvanigrella aquatica]|uniref:Uncharacterized protein n=1 Tax=Silvanigrella aquatica TaxID=1915309 RepID=A0A1L4D2H2_9BACT|nr:hypothetical protein [Silvanigrella aquatica]APJ04405.1 hypothetical protein AXG55_11000 [Silvanigrella aquatica]
MDKRNLIFICSGLLIALGISFYITKNQTVEEIEIKNSNNKKIETQNSNENMKSKEQNQKLNLSSTPPVKNMTPTEYVAWVQDPNNRVLLEIRDDGAKIYRKGNVTITVFANGKEIYLPDEI